MKTPLITLLVLFGLSACGQPERTDATADRYPPGSPEYIALAAVAERTGLALDSLEVSASTARDFSDSSLGCPKPGMAYQQVITPGHQVTVVSAERSFDVRVARGRGRICERPTPN